MSTVKSVPSITLVSCSCRIVHVSFTFRDVLCHFRNMFVDLHTHFSLFLLTFIYSAWWNIELGAFVLNFGGRVKVASVKNFQLCERDVQDHIMQFGRIEGRHSFTMDFQYPLTPMQAFAIAISSLQSKISFG